MLATKTHPPVLPVWLDWKTVTYAKISLKMVNPRVIAGNTEEEELWYRNDSKTMQRGLTD